MYAEAAVTISPELGVYMICCRTARLSVHVHLYTFTLHRVVTDTCCAAVHSICHHIPRCGTASLQQQAHKINIEPDLEKHNAKSTGKRKYKNNKKFKSGNSQLLA